MTAAARDSHLVDDLRVKIFESQNFSSANYTKIYGARSSTEDKLAVAKT